MYQPQEKDFIYPNWESRFKLLSQQGFKTVIIQWSSYGTHRFYEKHPFWIKSIMKYAKQYNMEIIFGLYADPDYFKKIENHRTEIKNYLQKLYRINVATARRLSLQLDKDKAFKGWYIYDEINDEAWQDAVRGKALKAYLYQLDHALNSLTPDKKIMISAYFSSKTAPEEYVKFLNETLPEKWILLLQSGVGAGLVTPQKCQTYFKTFSAAYHHQWFPVIELFSFSGEIPKADYEIYEKQYNCRNKNYILFSWRYFFAKDFLQKYNKSN
ncbi:DUF4434 domain-containing protein [Sulfurovum sp.]|uniref:DUF4434 domain-containing protein n=1 Tax=Sulfurovum sp. TaxID=1969726 RepID=UPI0025EFC67A|nr:DUF4434 domain-containing protein [Sulfurovum sp.]